MRISGHKTRAIFYRYNMTSERDQRNASEKLTEHHWETDERFLMVNGQKLVRKRLRKQQGTLLKSITL